MTQQAFANFIDISTASLSGILTGRTKPTLNTVEAIRKSFPTINIEWLMFGTGEMFADGEAPDTAAAKNEIADKEEKEASKYLKAEVSSAESLINQLDLRRSTLDKVGRVLLEKQKSFFAFGPRSLKPLTLKEVADEIGVHETTVSRITTSKYIDTDWGLFQLKELFPSGIQNEDTGVTFSKTAVKDMVREIIENNTTGKALSDQKISDMLAQKGISCARRTVNKYRKELDIDSSYIRGV